MKRFLSIKDKKIGEEVFQIDFQSTPQEYRKRRTELFSGKYSNRLYDYEWTDVKV